MFLKYCKNVTGGQNMLMYIFGRIAYIFNRGADASEAIILKRVLVLACPCRDHPSICLEYYLIGMISIYLEYHLKINILIYFRFLVSLSL